MKKSVKLIITSLIALLLAAVPVGGDMAEKTVYAVPGGETVGMKLYIDGLLIVGFSDIPSQSGKASPGKNAGLKKGDRIVRVNGEDTENIRNFSKRIQESKGSELILEIERDDEVFQKRITPVYYNDAGQYKIGIWVRDSAAGIGTVSFVLPDGRFAAVGHGITDSDTEKLITLTSGEVTGSHITSGVKGREGVPGELRGVLDNSTEGQIILNTENGIYGKLTKYDTSDKAVEIGKSSDVTEGSAVIRAEIEGEKVDEYEIEIQKVMRFTDSNGKCMIIKVTDERLLELTGGIVQGMSGSPVIQNGRIVGAVTHVFLNDPTRGYAVFADRMLKEVNKW